jgi:hypothetical protein
VIYNRDVSNMHNLHKKKLDGMKSTLASLGYSAKPKTIPQVVRANLKKRMFEDERLAEIEVIYILSYFKCKTLIRITGRLRTHDFYHPCPKLWMLRIR